MIRPKGYVYSCPGCGVTVATLTRDVASGERIKRTDFEFSDAEKPRNQNFSTPTVCCNVHWLSANGSQRI